MTGTSASSYWNRFAGLLLAVASGCSNDRFVVVGRLHSERQDASVTGEPAPDAALGESNPSDAEVSSSLDTPRLDAGLATSTTSLSTSAPDGGCVMSTPIHRYSFDGTGNQAPNLAGAGTAELRGGATLTNTGSLTLDGDDDFVALAPDLWTMLASVTIMVWVRYDGGPAYVRLFDFGTSSAGVDPPEGEAAVGRTYLALTPATGYDPPGLTALVATEGSGSEVLAASDAQIGDDIWHQVSVVLDGDDHQLRLYLDGVLLAQNAIEHTAADITNANNWLGRSQYDADPYTEISYDEVRLYANALPNCAITAAFSNGPDVL